jgi:CheY-like chemotaxis protein
VDKLTRTQFIEYLKSALVHLYDAEYLRQTPLLAAFRIENRFDAATVLRNICIETIESLKPDPNFKDPERAWRTYGSLYYPYVQRLSQQAVADQLGMSTRHLRREQRAALDALAEMLCQEYGLYTLFCDDPQGDEEVEYDPQDEFEWLEETLIEAPLDLYACIPNTLEMIRSLAAEYQVEIESYLQPELPNLMVHPVAFDQMMLSLLSIAIVTSPKGQVNMHVSKQADEVLIKVEAHRAVDYIPSIKNADVEKKYEITKRLAGLSHGIVRFVEKPDLFFALLSLPFVNQIPVLAVDDNPDVLQMMQRYAQNSRYEMITTPNPSQIFGLIEQFEPKAILLDVMIPEIDGWKILGRISENPATSDIPVIICTVLPQEELAHSLGAVAFLKKPFSRYELLSILDQLVELKASEFH